MEYLYRKAEMQDFNEVTALFREAVEHLINNGIFQWDEIYPNEEVLLEDIINEEMYILKQDNKLVACAVINEECDELYGSADWKYTEGKAAIIHRLCVHPKAQGAGNGKRMMQHTQALIKEMGYQAIRLDAFAPNHTSLRLYEGLGFSYAAEVQFRKGQFYLLEKSLEG